MQIHNFLPTDTRWEELVAHLCASEQARWVLTEDGQPNAPDLYFIGALVDGQVVGSLTLKKQPLIIPATEWADNQETPLKDEQGEILSETFVQTFFVHPDHRRQGIGLALQQEALLLTKGLACWQMRSWSSLDKPGNYQLKLKLGFAFHPAVFETPSGLKVSGGYFVRRIDQ